MSLPICELCAKAPVLCSSCEKRLQEGVINEYDVEASRVFFELFKSKVDLVRAFNTEEYVIVIVKGDVVGDVIGRGGTNIKILKERLLKPVKVIGQDSLNEMATALAAPAKVENINVVVKPGGGTKVRVRIGKAEKCRLRMRPEDLQRIISAASDRDVELAFD
jgi:transcription antitermination factor NusA-like protein